MRAFAIGMFVLLLVGMALGKYGGEDAMNIDMLPLAILFFGIGFFLNYFGWKIYHFYIMIIGFILFSIIGAILGVGITGWKDGALIFGLLGGIAGAWLAPKIEKVIFLIGAFVIGLILGQIIMLFLGLIKYETIDLEIILTVIIAIAVAIIAWKIYKFFIIVSLSIIGSLLMLIGYGFATTGKFLTQIDEAQIPLSLFLVFLISGVFVQYMKKSQTQKIEAKPKKEGKITVNLTSFVLPNSIKGFKMATLYLITGILISLIGSGYLLNSLYTFQDFILGAIILSAAFLLFKSNDRVILSNQEIISILFFITAFNVFLKILFYSNFIIFIYSDPVSLEYQIRYFLYILWWSHGIEALSALRESFYQTLILSLFIEIISFVYLYKSLESRKIQRNN